MDMDDSLDILVRNWAAEQQVHAANSFAACELLRSIGHMAELRRQQLCAARTYAAARYMASNDDYVSTVYVDGERQ
jgi:hypothetical protein